MKIVGFPKHSNLHSHCLVFHEEIVFYTFAYFVLWFPLKVPALLTGNESRAMGLYLFLWLLVLVVPEWKHDILELTRFLLDSHRAICQFRRCWVQRSGVVICLTILARYLWEIAPFCLKAFVWKKSHSAFFLSFAKNVEVIICIRSKILVIFILRFILFCIVKIW